MIRIIRIATRLLAKALTGPPPAIAVSSIKAGLVPCRLYSPSDADDHPPLLFFHGGGFLSCGLDTHDVLCRRLALASGLRVLAVSYRLAPEHPAPTQLDDALEACHWALSEPAALGGNSRTIMMGGDSAGGYLAARCSLALNQNSQAVVRQLLLYPLISLAHTDWNGAGAGRLASAFIRRQLGSPDAYPSLLQSDLSGMPDTLLISGGRFDPVSHSNLEFAAALRTAGLPVDHLVLPNLFHGALNAERLSSAAGTAIAYAGTGLRQQANRLDQRIG